LTGDECTVGAARRSTSGGARSAGAKCGDLRQTGDPARTGWRTSRFSGGTLPCHSGNGLQLSRRRTGRIAERRLRWLWGTRHCWTLGGATRSADPFARTPTWHL